MDSHHMSIYLAIYLLLALLTMSPRIEMKVQGCLFPCALCGQRQSLSYPHCFPFPILEKHFSKCVMFIGKPRKENSILGE